MSNKRPIQSISPPHTPADSIPPLTKTPTFLTISPKTIAAKLAALDAYTDSILAQPGSTVREDPIVHNRDRYAEIKPYANNQIKLTSLDHPYINASPIDLGYANETFIATQGPESSVAGAGLFWEMVWQTMAGIVVMLTPYFERGKERCGNYFPRDVGQVKSLGKWGSVECISRVKECGTEVRELKITKVCEDGSMEERMVMHFHFLAWPDLDVPKTEEDILALLALVKMTRFRIENLTVKYLTRPGGVLPPRIVHCSAGVSRTGTFIALDFLLRESEDEKWTDIHEDSDPIFETVKKLREQRMGLVYKPAQYAFLYQVLAGKWATQEGLRLASIAEAEEARAKKRCRTKG
ncbi:hypothetical protein VTL71DRAFT_407 [Oculimacula yallundae]|uniref:Uncharacterized protein n=1 Tax=Oculimacula yallundae TaxID=86028 RepID=A0ABR4CZY6_9HELO